MKKIFFIVIGLLLTNIASAKLPPPSEEAKAKAVETKAKAAWGDKVSAYKLCLAQDKVAARYVKSQSKPAGAVASTPACQDPGAYVKPEVVALAPAAAPVAAASPTAVPGGVAAVPVAKAATPAAAPASVAKK